MISLSLALSLSSPVGLLVPAFRTFVTKAKHPRARNDYDKEAAYESYSQFQVIRVGEFGLRPYSLRQSLIFLLETPVLLVVLNRGMH